MARLESQKSGLKSPSMKDSDDAFSSYEGKISLTICKSKILSSMHATLWLALLNLLLMMLITL